MSKSQEQSAIIFVKRPELRDLVRQCLKAQNFKVENFFNASSPKEFKQFVADTPTAVCILDWQQGMDALTQTLAFMRDLGKVESHPVLLMSPVEDKGIPAFAREYLVSKVLIGQVSFDALKKTVQQICKMYAEVNPIKDELIAAGRAQREGRMDEALKILKDLHETYPESVRLHTELAEVHAHMQSWSEVKQCLQPLVESEVANPRVWHLYARSLLKLGDTDGALRMMERAKILNPQNLERLLEIGSILVQDNQASKAATVYNEAVQLAPQSKEAKVGQAVSHLLMDEVNEVLDLMRSHTLGRELGAVFNLAGVVACHSRQFDLSQKLYSQAIQQVEKQHELAARVYYNKGIACYKQDKIEDAIQMFEKAVTLDPALEQAASNRRVLVARTHKNAGYDDSALNDAEIESQLQEVHDIMAGSFDEDEESELDRLMNRSA